MLHDTAQQGVTVVMASLQAEGLELMQLILKEKRVARLGSLKVLDFATTRCPPACERWVDLTGLKQLFAIFMGKSKVYLVSPHVSCHDTRICIGSLTKACLPEACMCFCSVFLLSASQWPQAALCRVYGRSRGRAFADAFIPLSTLSNSKHKAALCHLHGSV